MILFLLIIEVVFFCYWERKLYKTFITPIILLSVPYTIIVTLAYFFADDLGYFKFDERSILIWIIGLFIFWIVGNVVSVFFHQQIKEFKNIHEKPLQLVDNNIVNLFSISIIVIIIIEILPWIKSNGLGSFGDEAFTKFYSTGLSGHLLNLVKLLTIFYIGSFNRKNSIGIILLLITLGLLFLYQVKTWIFIPILGGLILRALISSRRKINIRYILYGFSLVLLIFSIAYSFTIPSFKNIFSDSSYLKFILSHARNYTFAGVMGNSEWIKNGMDMQKDIIYLFAPLKSIFNVIFGDAEYHNIISDDHILISESGFKTNVKTFFGTILNHSGLLNSIWYIVLISGITYFTYIIAVVKRNYWLLIIIGFILSTLILACFDYYFNNLAFYEIPVYCLILYLFSKFKLRVNLINNNRLKEL